MEKIVSEYSLWYTPLCLLAGFIYAFVLYFREKKNEYPAMLRWVLAVIRGLAVSAIAFLLLNPLIRSIRKEAEKPVVILLQDNSESVVTGRDSVYYTESYPKDVNDFMDDIRKKYTVEAFTFGGDLHDGLDIDYIDQETNIAKAFDGIYDRFSHTNVGALVLLSDGINNRGLNPLYSDHNFNFPVYSVALGDTSVQKDLIISHVNFNRIAYLDNNFPLEISVSARKCSGLAADVHIERNNEVLFSARLNFGTDNDFKTVQTTLTAREKGLQRYTVRISRVDGEVSYSNNASDIFIDVLEDKQKILILYDAPHPDVSAIKQTIAENINYTSDDFPVRDFHGQVGDYNLVILHGLPSAENNMTTLLSQLEDGNIPTLFILTEKTFLPLLNEQKTGLVYEDGNMLYDEALPSMNSDFNLFTLTDNAREALAIFPPLISPVGGIELLPSANPFLYQQIGVIPTQQPLWIFNQSLERKTAVILGPGIWKWRIKDYAVTGSHLAFDEILNKTIQYLALRVDKSLFRVYGPNNFAEQEDIEFEAEVYNESYELVNDGEVSITITGSDGSDYPFTFSKTSNAYYLNAGSLPPDSYSYAAKAVSGNRTLTDNGEFTVSSSRLETINTEADHSLLFNLASKYGGEMVYPDQLGKLAGIITSRDDIKTIVYSQKRFSELLNLPYLLILLLFLLTVEWFVRKRAGGY